MSRTIRITEQKSVAKTKERHEIAIQQNYIVEKTFQHSRSQTGSTIDNISQYHHKTNKLAAILASPRQAQPSRKDITQLMQQLHMRQGK